MRRALLAEGLGSMLLAATVIGSGIMAERLAAGNRAIALLANTGATVAVLAALIALLGPVSGAHFNPAVSIAQALRGVLSWPKAGAYTVIQIAGCCAGALLAHAMFELPLMFANPAITIARALSNTFAGIAPADVPAFILAQFLGALAALLLARFIFNGRAAAGTSEPTR